MTKLPHVFFLSIKFFFFFIFFFFSHNMSVDASTSCPLSQSVPSTAPVSSAIFFWGLRE